MGLDVRFINESSVLADVDAWRYAWACDYQARFHYGRAGWRGDVRCSFLPKGAPIPPESAILHLVDNIDVQGALGFHDEDGNEVPYAQVGVKTVQSDPGQQISEVCSHEVLELATDPHINLTAPTGDLKRLYAVEVGDPVQGNAYDVGDPEGRQTGVVVADFTLPSYYDPHTKADQPTSFRGSIKGPFALAAHGYYSFVDLTNIGGGWQQALGSERTSAPPPDGDDRLRRRGQS